MLINPYSTQISGLRGLISEVPIIDQQPNTTVYHTVSMHSDRFAETGPSSRLTDSDMDIAIKIVMLNNYRVTLLTTIARRTGQFDRKKYVNIF